MATRLYFQASTTPPLTPSFDGSWNSTTGAARCLLDATKAAATQTISSNIGATGPSYTLAVQAMSAPLAGGQALAGTVDIVSRGRELATTHNVNKRARAVKVINSAGVVQTTLVAWAATAATTELNATLAGQQHASANGLTAGYTTSAGDRIIVELGYGVGTSGTTPQSELVLGGTGTDHTNANNDTVGTVPWIEFSQNLTFQVTSDLDLRWAVATQVTSDLDLRWVASPPVTGIQQAVDSGWTTGIANPISSSAISVPANSLIIVDTMSDGTPPQGAPAVSGSGLTWTQIGTMQQGASGGFTSCWWAYTAGAIPSFVASADWSNGNTKAIKATAFSGTASSGAVISKTQGTSAVNNLNVTVTNTNDGARVRGAALDWNATGNPSSTDDEVIFFVSLKMDGLTAQKATNTVGTGQNVTINFDAAAALVPDWGYKVYEIVPSGSGTTQVNSDLDLRWIVSTQVNSDLDLRWAVSTQVTSDLDLRWAVATQVNSDLDLRWAVITRVISDLDLRWAVLTPVTSDLDLRWVVISSLTQVTSDLDLRWIVSTRVNSDLDLRWLSLTQVTSDLDLRWIVRNIVNADLNLQWATYTRVNSDLDLRWAVLTRVNSDVDLRWAVLLAVVTDLDLRWIADMPDNPRIVEYWGMKI